MDKKIIEKLILSIIIILSIAFTILAVVFFNKLNCDASIPNALILGFLLAGGLVFLATEFGYLEENGEEAKITKLPKEIDPICASCNCQIPFSDESQRSAGFVIDFDPENYQGYVCLNCHEILCYQCHDVKKNLFICQNCGKSLKDLHPKYLHN